MAKLSSRGFLGFYNTGNSFKEFFTKPWTTIKRPWQMKTGYNDLYDQGAKLIGIYINCLISEFMWNSRMWRVELWKGRYGISIGAEIGIYTNPKFYNDFVQWSCAINDELQMSLYVFYVKKSHGKYYGYELFSRSQKHWWLTGFLANVDLSKAGPFGNKIMIIAEIEFYDSKMAQSFVSKLDGDGYFIAKSYGKSVLIIWLSKNYGEVYL